MVLVLSKPTRAHGRAHAAPVSTDCSTYKLNERSYSRAPSSVQQHQPATQGKQVHCGVPHKLRARAYLVRPACSTAAAAALVAETTNARAHLPCSSIDYAPSATRAAAASHGTKGAPASTVGCGSKEVAAVPLKL